MSDQPPTERTFEEALAELEGIVRDLEEGTTGLDESLARYEAGIGLLKYCYGQLRQAEQRILKLTGTDEDGRPLTEPFEHAAAVELEEGRGSRRFAAVSALNSRMAEAHRAVSSLRWLRLTEPTRPRRRATPLHPAGWWRRSARGQ